jgi:hypothetical protein
MMINKKLNLSLKLNKSINNLANEGPFTPLDQMVKTPSGEYGGAGAPWAPWSQAPTQPKHSIYSNAEYNESDDILTDIDEPPTGHKSCKNYTLFFTATFDQLLLSVYSHFLSLPTTTPFLGFIPPSGLISKVANETMSNLLNSTTSPNPPIFDQQCIITSEYLKTQSFQPIFLQLIRKRLMDLCHNQVGTQKLPESTTVSITSSASGVSIHNASSSAIRLSSISNLSLTDLNISNFNNGNHNGSFSSSSSNRSRSSSMNLRKHSLTRNNSYTNNNWLHVGNIKSIRPTTSGSNDGTGAFTVHQNPSTESLQSIPDCVPQSFINRSAQLNSSGSYNSMMMDYQTPPSSNKGSISITPPLSQNMHIQNSIMNGINHDDDFGLDHQQVRSRSSSRGNSFPHPLTINTDSANMQALNALNGITGGPSRANTNTTLDGFALDSPFMSATTPSEDFGYFSNGFAGMHGDTSSGNSSASESPINIGNNANDMLVDSSKINLPNQFSLSEKKRESLKMKRGIH